MADQHIKRGFLDDSRLDNISVRSFETSTSVGQVIKSQRERETETSAESNIDNGQPKPATDTQGDWKEQGLVQCKRCGVAQEEGSPEAKKDFRFYIKNKVPYRCQYCKDCETDMRRTRRFNRVIPVSPYPPRIEEMALSAKS